MVDEKSPELYRGSSFSEAARVSSFSPSIGKGSQRIKSKLVSSGEKPSDGDISNILPSNRVPLYSVTGFVQTNKKIVINLAPDPHYVPTGVNIDYMKATFRRTKGLFLCMILVPAVAGFMEAILDSSYRNVMRCVGGLLILFFTIVICSEYISYARRLDHRPSSIIVAHISTMEQVFFAWVYFYRFYAMKTVVLCGLYAVCIISWITIDNLRSFYLYIFYIAFVAAVIFCFLYLSNKRYSALASFRKNQRSSSSQANLGPNLNQVDVLNLPKSHLHNDDIGAAHDIEIGGDVHLPDDYDPDAEGSVRTKKTVRKPFSPNVFEPPPPALSLSQQQNKINNSNNNHSVTVHRLPSALRSGVGGGGDLRDVLIAEREALDRELIAERAALKKAEEKNNLPGEDGNGDVREDEHKETSS